MTTFPMYSIILTLCSFFFIGCFQNSTITERDYVLSITKENTFQIDSISVSLNYETTHIDTIVYPEALAITPQDSLMDVVHITFPIYADESSLVTVSYTVYSGHSAVIRGDKSFSMGSNTLTGVTEKDTLVLNSLNEYFRLKGATSVYNQTLFDSIMVNHMLSLGPDSLNRFYQLVRNSESDTLLFIQTILDTLLRRDHPTPYLLLADMVPLEKETLLALAPKPLPTDTIAPPEPTHREVTLSGTFNNNHVAATSITITLSTQDSSDIRVLTPTWNPQLAVYQVIDSIVITSSYTASITVRDTNTYGTGWFQLPLTDSISHITIPPFDAWNSKPSITLHAIPTLSPSDLLIVTFSEKDSLGTGMNTGIISREYAFNNGLTAPVSDTLFTITLPDTLITNAPLIVTITDRDSNRVSDTILVSSIRDLPSITSFSSDSVYTVKDSISFTWSAHDSLGTITQYAIKEVTSPFWIEVTAERITIEPTTTIGSHSYYLRVTDDDNNSVLDSVTISVITGDPQITHFELSDSAVSINDSITLTVTLWDSLGTSLFIDILTNGDTTHTVYSAPSQTIQIQAPSTPTSSNPIYYTITDDEGNTISDSTHITVLLDIPLCTLHVNKTQESRTFTYSVSHTQQFGSIISYAWDFDGDSVIDSTTTSNNVTYTFPTYDTYFVMVTVTDDDHNKVTVSQSVLSGFNIPGHTLYLNEEFNTPILLTDSINPQDSIWQISSYQHGPKLQSRPENFTYTDSSVIITMNMGADYSSGIMRSIFPDFRYGTYQFRYKAPESISGWTSIDLSLQAIDTTKYYSYIDCLIQFDEEGYNLNSLSLYNPFGIGDINEKVWNSIYFKSVSFDDTPVDNRWHDVTLIWKPDTLSMTIDDKTILYTEETATGMGIIQVPTENFYLSIGYTWASWMSDFPNGAQTIELDYIRYFRWDGDSLELPHYTPQSIVPQIN
ncbi:MAG: PKD domain-containing protein [Fibrobacterales bacterium]